MALTRLPDAKERFALGQQCRKRMRRLEHKVWKGKDRRENPLKLLEASTKGRIPELVALKNELMAASPFAYFRGAVPVMAYDLSLIPNTGIHNQLCGDAHVRNLGTYAAQDGRLVFDINDFDETIVGPFEWDVKRMATSLILAGRGAGVKNLHCREVAAVFLERYRGTMAMFARMPVLEVARYQVHRLQHVASMEEIFRLAERATPMHALVMLTETSKSASQQVSKSASQQASKSAERGTRVFKTIPPRLTRVSDEVAEQVLGSLTKYRESLLPERRHFLAQYRPVDVAFKVVGDGIGRAARLLRFDGGQWGKGSFVSADQGRGRFSICAVCRSKWPQRWRAPRTPRGGGRARDAAAVGSISGMDDDGPARLPGAAVERS